MRLDTIEVTGFKSIRELKLKLHRLNVLIGANGAGKSNFIALFRLLNEMAEQRFQLFVRQQGGADGVSSLRPKEHRYNDYLPHFWSKWL